MVYNIDWVFEISLTNKKEGICMWYGFDFYGWFLRHDASYDYLSIVAKKTMKENERGIYGKKLIVQKIRSRRHSVNRGK
jgi:hypothetical protein